MLVKITTWLVTYVSVVLLFPVAIAVYRKKHLTKELKAVAVYLCFALFSEVVSIVTAELLNNNLPFLHFYTIIEFAIISWFYKTYLQNFIPKGVFYVAIALFSVLAVLNFIYVQPLTGFNTYPRGLESIIFVFFALATYYKMIKSLEIIYIEKSPLFWINAGFLFYFAGSLFLFVLGNLLLRMDLRLSMLSWAIHACLLGLTYIFIAIGLWYSPQQQEPR
ncbi:hypothetical protein [Emticicia sp. TH156]|uniref:hypothetical protein n=1 Tax=Emticicia sp. TH156 TaxID=2067454 RepID=UPI000C75A5DF|nr:hypothetical protein [Emticicia sp. TH156]PLK44744.1 hypothetical protein C0V77_09850 [Emticicia sp. TH156]